MSMCHPIIASSPLLPHPAMKVKKVLSTTLTCRKIDPLVILKIEASNSGPESRMIVVVRVAIILSTQGSGYACSTWSLE